LQSEGYSEM